ncbi:unnamed protein product [Leptosia nina]|uniref:Gustatory receptor n=1 Tax=Leptosia nina TaxID=320188 RepID=A0AAV1JVD3_9NEOP
MYNVFLGDQTLLRLLYETKICQYGDLVENTAITFYVLYTMWKISFDLSGSTQHVQQIMEIDVALERLGETVDYSRSAVMTLLIPIFQIGVCSVRILIVWISTSGRIESIPYSKLFQIVFSDSLSFTVMNHFCIYLYALYHRYRRLNTVLIKLQSSTFRDCFVRSKKCLSLAPRTQDRDACARINSCGKLYSMLFKATETVNDKFGLALLLTMFVWLVLIVLYLYYFMEATAGGLFHDVQRYINLLMYISWQVIFSVGIISSAIYCCEKIVKEAKFTSYVVHTIINYNSDVYAVKEAALNLSMQIVHQTPKFTARGLFPVEYVLLLENLNAIYDKSASLFP